MISENKKISYLFFVIILIFVLFTNSYFDYNQSLIFGGADGISYYEISKKSPYISDTPLKPIHAERFIFPYIIGIISKITSFDIFALYRLLDIFLIILINILLLNILNKYDKSLLFVIFSLLLFNLNPYQTRFYIANPLIITDLFFILGSIITIIGIDNKNKKLFFFGLLISSLARQSSIAIIIAIFLIKFFRKDKFFLSFLNVLSSLILFILIYLVGFTYTKMGLQDVTHSHIYFAHLFGIFVENVSIQELFRFLTWPFLSFGPLVFFSLFFVKFNKNFIKNNFETNIFILVFSLLIIAQPIISGAFMTGKNIIRLSSFSFVPILIFFIKNFNFKATTNIKKTIFLIILTIWTCHPTFSKFTYLESFKF
tara:strand:- start:116 stop:1225 length:1110 start_codon:yes stop_codon:yes gene_type:complete